VDWRTDVRTDGHFSTHVIRSTRRSRPNKMQSDQAHFAPRCRHLTNRAKHASSLILAHSHYYKKMTSLTVYYVMYCCQNRNESPPQVSCRENLVRFGLVVLRYVSNLTSNTETQKAQSLQTWQVKIDAQSAYEAPSNAHCVGFLASTSVYSLFLFPFPLSFSFLLFVTFRYVLCLLFVFALLLLW